MVEAYSQIQPDILQFGKRRNTDRDTTTTTDSAIIIIDEQERIVPEKRTIFQKFTDFSKQAGPMKTIALFGLPVFTAAVMIGGAAAIHNRPHMPSIVETPPSRSSTDQDINTNPTQPPPTRRVVPTPTLNIPLGNGGHPF